MSNEYSTVEASHGISWFSCGWKLFLKNPLIWIAMQLIFIVLAVLLSFIPVLGALAVNLLAPVLAGGMFIAADRCSRSDEITVGNLFTAFNEREMLKKLLVIGAIGLLFAVLSLMIGGVTMGGMMAGMESGQIPQGQVSPGAMGGVMVGGLISLVIATVWAMAAIFGIPLVSLNNHEPVAALKSSFKACLSNWLPLLIFGLISGFLFFVGSIPFGLGLLVVVPIVLCSAYCAFKSIYPDSTASSEMQV